MRVFRFNPERDRSGRFETYRVPYDPGMSVLDGLVKIRELYDSTLVFRYACRHSNTCKMCLALVNGKPGYLCATPVADQMTVEPLRSRPIIRDLVVDLGWVA
jgi:succinate dehydrogenase/fumarate reductase iron-sulfur protein